MYCKNCGTLLQGGSHYCNNCGVSAGSGRNFCQNCGRPITVLDRHCPGCGAPLEADPSAGGTAGWSQGTTPPPPYYGYGGYPGLEPRSRLVAALLGIFLGSLGIHNFYLGYNSRGLVQLLLSTVGALLTCGLSVAVVEVWAIVEVILLFCGSVVVDGRGIPLRD